MKSLYESILDDEDVIIAKSDKYIISQWIKDNVVGDYKLFTSGGLKIRGNFIIRNCKDLNLIPLNIIDFNKGGLYIDNCDFTSLEGLFENKYKIYKCNISITNCPNLKSLEGLPQSLDGDIVISNNKSLRNLNGFPKFVLGDISVIKNGKKFSDSYIRSLLDMDSKYAQKIDIFCSELDNESSENMITESLVEPYLLKLSTQLKKEQFDNSGHKKPFGTNFKDILKKIGIAWDKVTPEHVTVYKTINNDTLLAARKIISRHKSGLILLLNNKGEFTHIIHDSEGKYPFVYTLDPGKTYDSNNWYTDQWTYTDVMNIIKKADRAVIYDLPMNDDRYLKNLNTFELRSQRRIDKEGIVLMGDPDYDAQVIKDNNKRYKNLIAKMKLEKNNDVDKINKSVEDILHKVMLLNRKAQQGNINIPSYTISFINKKIYGIKQYNRGQSFGENGLMYVYSQYSDYYLTIKQAKESDLNLDYYKKELDEYKKELDNLIKRINSELSQYGV